MARTDALHDQWRAAGFARPFENKAQHELKICQAADLLRGRARNGADAITRAGQAAELKAWDIASGGGPQWATSRDLTRPVLDRYRATPLFYFAVFDGLALLALYEALSADLEGVFQRLEEKIVRYERGEGPRPNNPKFSFADVRPVARVIVHDPRFPEPKSRAPSRAAPNVGS